MSKLVRPLRSINESWIIIVYDNKNIQRFRILSSDWKRDRDDESSFIDTSIHAWWSGDAHR